MHRPKIIILIPDEVDTSTIIPIRVRLVGRAVGAAVAAEWVDGVAVAVYEGAVGAAHAAAVAEGGLGCVSGEIEWAVV